MDITRVSGDLGSLSSWVESSTLTEISVRALPCPKVPIYLLYTGSLPTDDARFSGKITVTPDLVYNKPPCTPATLGVQFKPDAGPSLATSEPVEYWAVFSYTETSTSTTFGDISYRMSWMGGSDGLWQVDVPLKDWSSITSSGTVKTRVEVLPTGGGSGAPLYTAYAPGVVTLDICPGDLAMTCPIDQYSVEKSPMGTIVDLPVPAMTGGCGGYSVTCSPPSGSPFPLGVTSVLCTGKDSCGSTATCSMKVNITTAPPVVISCPADISVTTSSDAGKAVTYALPGAGGGCTNPTVTCVPPSGSTFPVGVTPVLCTASDTCFHSNSCTFRVTVTKLSVPTSQPPPPINCGQFQDPNSCAQNGNTCQWIQDQQNPNGTCVNK